MKGPAAPVAVMVAVPLQELAQVALNASIFDETPEGKSIVILAEKLGASLTIDRSVATGLEFSARTRMSGTDLPNNIEVRKGAVDAGSARRRGDY